MNDPKKMLTRRALLLQASAGVMTVSLHARGADAHNI
jgi:hypothetical protein